MAWNWLLSCMVSLPKLSKSLSRYAFSISAMRGSTTFTKGKREADNVADQKEEERVRTEEGQNFRWITGAPFGTCKGETAQQKW